MKPVTLDLLATALDADLTWRIREISDLKRSIDHVPLSLRRAPLRAALPLLYAHWEGHVRNCVVYYIRYVAARRRKYGELKRGFTIPRFQSEFSKLAAGSLSRQDMINFIGKLEDTLEETCKALPFSMADTKANLSYQALLELEKLVGLSPAIAEAEQMFIDKLLLERRNTIAHGSDISLTESDFEQVADKVIDLMRVVRNSIENAAVLEAFAR